MNLSRHFTLDELTYSNKAKSTNRGVILLADAAGKVAYTGFNAQQALEIAELVSRSAVVEGPSEYVEMADEPELKGAPRGAGRSAATPGAAAKPAPKVTPRTAAKAPGKVKKAVSKKTPANSKL